MSGWVYLLHFSQPIADGHPCRHYIGSAADLWTRIAQHRAGKGARLTEVAHERGIGVVVASIWPVPVGLTLRQLERQLKRRKNAPKLCPICRGKLEFTIATIDELAF